MELDTLYLTVLLVSGGVTIIYVLLSDVFDSIAIFDSWLSPAFVLSAISFFSASAYLLEKFSPLSSVVSAGISLVVASMLAILFNLFILTPLQHTEESTAYSEEDLEGEYGEIILSIPAEGFGEIVVRLDSGTIAKTATSMDGKPISAGATAVIMKIENDIAYVSELTDPLLD
jgi:hypothetical protein